jgi:hypothetical protein
MRIIVNEKPRVGRRSVDGIELLVGSNILGLVHHLQSWKSVYLQHAN